MENKQGHMEQLNDMQELFLDLAGCFVHGEKAALVKLPQNLVELANFAAVHKMSPAVFEVLRTSLPQEALSAEPVWNGWKGSVIREVLSQTSRTEGFLDLYQKLTTAGVKPLVVKGIICRSLYEKPEYRVSADEDVLVQKSDAAECDRILLELGYRRGELNLDKLPHEIGYRNPVNGVYLELHFSLFDEADSVFGNLNEAFNDIWSDAMSARVQKVDVWTLHPTKHFLYLLCHCYKHFLYSGFGVRQVCDIVRMAESLGDVIDWTYVKEQLVALHMKQFVQGLLNIGYGWLHMKPEVYTYLGFSVPDKEGARSEAMDLLRDILQAGIYGSSTKERQHSANVTLAAAKKENAFAHAIFPSVKYLKSRYPFAKKYPVLLPAAWSMRIGRYIVEVIKSKAQASGKDTESRTAGQEGGLQIGKKRVELLRKYGLIE